MTNIRNAMMAAAGVGGGGHTVDNSILGDGSSDYLKRTIGTSGSTTTATFSFWYKPCGLGTNRYLYSSGNDAGGDTADYFSITFNTSDQFAFDMRIGGVDEVQLITTRVFRDPHAWYYFVVNIDLADGTAADRVRVYVNGVRETDWATNTNNLNGTETSVMFTAGEEQYVGGWFFDQTNPFDGYFSEFVCIDGTDLAPTSFGEFDTNGVWRPIDVSGLTFGTNGFYLPFTTSTFLGADANNTGTVVNSYQSSQWTGNTGSYSFADGFIDATTVDDAINSVDTFTGDFELEFYITDKGNVCVGVYEIDEDGTFDQNSSTGGMSSMTDSWWIKTSSVAANNDVMYGSTEVAGTVGWADGDTVKITRSSGTFTVYRNGSSLHEWSQTSSNEVRIVVSQGDTNVILDQFCWVDAGTIANNFFTSGSPTQSSDTPTNLIATLSPLWTDTTLSNGNLTATAGTNAYEWAISTIAIPSSGKWVFEATRTSGTYARIGVARMGDGIKTGGNDLYVLDAGNGEIAKNAVLVTTVTTPGASVIRVEYDADTDTIEFFDDGASVHSATMALTSATGPLVFVAAPYASGTSVDVTFDENNFAGTPSTGFLGLSSANLYANAAPAIANPDDHFKEVTVSHDGTSTNFTIPWSAYNGSTGIYDTLFEIKRLGSAEKWFVLDSIRGLTKYFSHDATTAEATDSNVLSVSTTTGTLGTTLANDTYLVRMYRLGAQASRDTTNSEGTITGSGDSLIISANTTAGWSLCTYTGTATNATFGHGLNDTPEWVRWFNLVSASGQTVYHELNPGTAATDYGNFDSVVALTNTDATKFNSTAPTSTLNSVGTADSTNGSGDGMWCFSIHSVGGFSKIGSFIGNGSADGPLFPTDINIKSLTVKNANDAAAGDHWFLVTDTRFLYNGDSATLFFDGTDVENATNLFDLLSNGGKVRTTNGGVNEDTDTMVYHAIGSPSFGATPATAR